MENLNRMLLGKKELGEIKNVGSGGGKVGLRTSYYTKANVIMLRLIFLLYVVKMRSGILCLGEMFSSVGVTPMFYFRFRYLSLLVVIVT
jgi:hypothetical protein